MTNAEAIEILHGCVVSEEREVQKDRLLHARRKMPIYHARRICGREG
jgi:hypothetical protein